MMLLEIPVDVALFFALVVFGIGVLAGIGIAIVYYRRRIGKHTAEIRSITTRLERDLGL